MGKIVNATYMTLDGDIQNLPEWHFDYFGDEARQLATGQLFLGDAVLMGRETYEGFEPAWTARAGVDEFADRMNSIKKYVVSTTLRKATWNNTTVIGGSDDVVAELRELREREGTVLQYGYGAVTRLLLENDLLDELRIWLHPVLSGNAKPGDLLYRDTPRTKFALNGVETHSTGLIVLNYTPTKS